MTKHGCRCPSAYRIAAAVLGCIAAYVVLFTPGQPTSWRMDMTTPCFVAVAEPERPKLASIATPTTTADLASSPPLIFIHVGDDKDHFPPYWGEAVRQAVRWNPGMRVLVVLSQKFLNGSDSSIEKLLSSPYPEDVAYWKEHIEVLPSETVPLSKRRARFMNASTLDTGFRSGFWKYTTERLFALSEVLDHLGIDEAFHMENDNMLYARLGDLLPVMRRLYPKLACTNIGDGLATAGFFYVHDRRGLDPFLDFVVENAGLNDMQTLWQFAAKHGRGSLAILPADPVASAYTDIAEVRQLKGVYDGAAHGQLLGGTDNGHPPGFVNPPSGVGGYEYRWHVDDASGLRRPYVRSKDASLATDGWVPIFNLHIHCKQLYRFAS